LFVFVVFAGVGGRAGGGGGVLLFSPVVPVRWAVCPTS